MSEPTGLLFAYCLDGQGGGQRLDAEAISQWNSEQGTLWVHLDCNEASTQDWLHNESGIDPLMQEALMASETRPRSVVLKDSMLVILRGVNLNYGADPEDMVSIRFWLEEHRIITMRRRKVMAIEDLRLAVEAGSGPVGPGAFLEELSERLIERMGDVITEVDDAFDALEDEVLLDKTYELRPKLAALRRQVISLRRHIAPQRDVIARLQNEKVKWLSEQERMRLREVGDRTTRHVEDLDAIRDRATVTQEELSSSLSEQMNRTMYVLSIVAGIFLPLGFLTGLLGVNVGGIPGTENPWAFSIFCVVLVLIVWWQIWLYKRKKWM